MDYKKKYLKYKKKYQDFKIFGGAESYIRDYVKEDILQLEENIRNYETNIEYKNINREKYITGLDIHIYDYSKIIDKYSEEIPGEFIDPIYYSPISFPLELPGTKTIVDKNVIMNHLFFKSTNPFNGLKLTRDELLEYNTDKEVIIRLDEFVINFNTWKISHKIYSY